MKTFKCFLNEANIDLGISNSVEIEDISTSDFFEPFQEFDEDIEDYKNEGIDVPKILKGNKWYVAGTDFGKGVDNKKAHSFIDMIVSNSKLIKKYSNDPVYPNSKSKIAILDYEGVPYMLTYEKGGEVFLMVGDFNKVKKSWI